MIKYTFDIVLAVPRNDENADALRQLNESGHEFSLHPLQEPNGEQFFVLTGKRASAKIEEDQPESLAMEKAIKTACFFYRQENEGDVELTEFLNNNLIFGLEPEFVRAQVVA